MTDKAKEYAEQAKKDAVICQLEHSGVGASLRMLPEIYAKQIEFAYRAGYQAGQTDAHRKEWVQPQPTEFPRGL